MDAAEDGWPVMTRYCRTCAVERNITVMLPNFWSVIRHIWRCHVRRESNRTWKRRRKPTVWGWMVIGCVVVAGIAILVGVGWDAVRPYLQ